MTFDRRARAKELADELALDLDHEHVHPIGTIVLDGAASAIESALLAFAREVLTPQRKKDAAVMHMTAKLCALPEDDNGRISRSDAMELVMQWRMKWDAANRAKSLEDGA